MHVADEAAESLATQQSTDAPQDAAASEYKESVYAWYVLLILTVTYVLNLIDRQIVSILANDIKADLGVSDDYIGFIYGTAFGVFYALFGIPLGRLADNWHRTRLLSIGLALWSAMTALSGISRNALALALARVGVGVGEAVATPGAWSLISDWFSKKRRALAIGIYTSGVYIGGGLALACGGLILDYWKTHYPVRELAPLGLAGWQVAFFAVGLPGLLAALWTSTMREPLRGQSEGISSPNHPAPFRSFFQEVLTIVPPFMLIGAARRGTRALAANVATAVIIAATVYALVAAGELWMQWCAFGVGLYSLLSWTASLKARDLPSYQMIFGTPAFLLVIFAYGLNSCLSYTVKFWSAPYIMRTFEVSAISAGWMIGSLTAFGGVMGVILGGWMADLLRARTDNGRIWIVLAGAVLPMPCVLVGFTTSSLSVFYLMYLLACGTAPVAIGAAAATTQDLVLPRMRGTATAAIALASALMGIGLGPYVAGRVATVTDDLATGVMSILLTVPVAAVAGLLALKLVPRAEASRFERARAAGEHV